MIKPFVIVVTLVSALIGSSFAAAQTTAPEPAPIEIIIIGAFHLNNPGRDIHNAQIDSVLTPQKQAELARISQDIARFRPTAIAIERVAADQATLTDVLYDQYGPDDLLTDADERVQIGYRLARLAQVSRVYGIDEKDRPDEPTYFPYSEMATWAESHGRSGDLADLSSAVRLWLAGMEQRQRTETLGQMLSAVNTAEMADWGQASYYRFLTFGGQDQWPGADLNGRWYTRNARIFAKLVRVAEPGDRIVVLFGAGHAYWLRHFAQTTPGFRLVEPNQYLSERSEVPAA